MPTRGGVLCDLRLFYLEYAENLTLCVPPVNVAINQGIPEAVGNKVVEGW